MSTIIDSIEKDQLRRVPRFAAGDRVRVHFRVVEGTRTRTQVFEGVVIKRQGNGARETFTVRKQSFGVGVERTFPVHSPKIEQLEVAARGAVRRAKLYYLRDRVGKAARVAERRWGITEDVLADDSGAVDAEGTVQEQAPKVVEEAAGPDGEAVEAEPEAEAVDAGAADADAAASEEGGEAPADSGDAEAPESEAAEEPPVDDGAAGADGDATEDEASERDA